MAYTSTNRWLHFKTCWIKTWWHLILPQRRRKWWPLQELEEQEITVFSEIGWPSFSLQYPGNCSLSDSTRLCFSGLSCHISPLAPLCEQLCEVFPQVFFCSSTAISLGSQISTQLIRHWPLTRAITINHCELSPVQWMCKLFKTRWNEQERFSGLV